jgi:hypothetical protein
MHYFGGVHGKGRAFFAIFSGDHLEDLPQLGQCLFPRGHEGVAALYRGNLRNPAIGIVAVQNYLVIVETHASQFYYRPDWEWETPWRNQQER